MDSERRFRGVYDELLTESDLKADRYFLIAVALGSFGFIGFSFLGMLVLGIFGIIASQIFVSIFTLVFSFKAKKYGSTHYAGFILGSIDSLIIFVWILLLILGS